MVFIYKDYEYKPYSKKQLNKFYKSKKIFIFDLDDTLILNNYNNENYNDKIYKFLIYLKNKGKILAIASHNGAPKFTIKMYNKKILNLFESDDILGAEEVVSKDQITNLDSDISFTNGDYIYYKKTEMIKKLIKKYDLKFKDVIFFDNDKGHILDALGENIVSILVDPKDGIKC